MQKKYDLVVVGAGVIGLATAFRASQKGLKVAVVEKNAKATGASIRNFGFVTVSGQRAGAHWERAKKTREIWAQIAPKAGIEVCHSGLHLSAQRVEAVEVLQEFAQTKMGEECKFLSKEEIAQQAPYLKAPREVLYSPHELRVESKTAIPLFAKWLQETQGVDFFYQTSVQSVELPSVKTSRGAIESQACVVCPGAELTSLFPEEFAKSEAKLCSLNMLRAMPKQAFKLNAANMSDLSLARYDGFAHLESGKKLAKLLEQEMPEYRKAGIHLIVVQSKDGSLVLGDSHIYDDAEEAFRDEKFDAMILSEFNRMLDVGDLEIIERWNGVYPSADETVFKTSPQKNLVLGTVTGGTGASTCFAFADELLADLEI